MTFLLDPEVSAILNRAVYAAPAGEVPQRGDAVALRAMVDYTLQATDDLEPDSPNVRHHDQAAQAADGSEILVRWYTKAGSRPGSAVVYFHGGGMICGSVANYHRLVSRYVESTGVPFLSVGYRLAPEFTGSTLVDDGLAALEWFLERAEEFGVEHDRIALMGDSGGGGVAAGVAIAARDTGIRLAKQLLMYPMLDDRTEIPDPELVAYATWTYDDNATGWGALLGAARGTADVPPRISPARLTDPSGLPPAYIDVGELDIFRDESVAYALILMHGGVSTELHVRPGVPHAFDRLAASSEIAQRSWADRLQVIRSL